MKEETRIGSSISGIQTTRKSYPGHSSIILSEMNVMTAQMHHIFIDKPFGKFILCAQLRVCSLTGGSPVYPRPNQPDISESWDGASNDI